MGDAICRFSIICWKLLQQLARGVLGAVAREVLQPVEHALEVALAQRAGVAVERAGELLLFFCCSTIDCR